MPPIDFLVPCQSWWGLGISALDEKFNVKHQSQLKFNYYERKWVSHLFKKIFKCKVMSENLFDANQVLVEHV